MVSFWCSSCKEDFKTSAALSSHMSQSTKCSGVKPTLKPVKSKSAKLKLKTAPGIDDMVADAPQRVIEGKVACRKGMDVTVEGNELEDVCMICFTSKMP